MMRRFRLVLPVWKLWLVKQPFRVLRVAARSFGPGARNAVEYLLRKLSHRVFEPNRLHWRAVGLLNGRGRRK